MAHKKGVGSSKNGRESESKRLGIKIFGGAFAKAGNIIKRQRGTVHHPGLTLVWVRTTLFTLLLMAQLYSRPRLVAHTSALIQFKAKTTNCS